MTAGTLRGRLALSLSLTLAVTVMLGGGALIVSQSRALERQLDASLRAHARSEIETATDRPDHLAHLHNDTLDVSGTRGETLSLAKYAALYAGDGRVLAQTSTFDRRAPRWNPRWMNAAFDLRASGAPLRAVVLPMGAQTEARALLLAVPRGPLDATVRDQALIAAALLAVAVALATGVATWLARWLTRDLDAIARTAREVSHGDLDARVGVVGGVAEIRALALDLDQMIARLAGLVATQRRFVSDAAHELRAPLTSLRGELELALRRPRTADEYREALTRAHADVLSLAALADDLLALARARTDAANATARVGDATARVVELLRAAGDERNVTLTAAVPEGLTVRFAPRDLERVVRNLAENALRHAPAGSTVRITAEPHERSVILAVEDDGEGVPVEQAERIFEPFVRLDPARQRDAGGTGLGLAITRELCRAAGGDVTLDLHREGAGARFVVRMMRG